MWNWRRRRVSDAWRTQLPNGREAPFRSIQADWQASHAMMSVALDDAMSLRSSGELICARQQARVSAELLERLGCQLQAACEVFLEESRHLSAPPTVDPLNAKFFRGETSRRLAAWNTLLHQVLLSSRSRCSYKLRFLENALAKIAEEYSLTADEIAEGIATQPAAAWALLECLQYDATTCLREAQVLLKSFLHVMPTRQVETLQARLDERTTQLQRLSSPARDLSSILPE